MADLSSLSDDEFLALASARGLEPLPSGLDALLSGVERSPEVLMSLPRGFYDIGETGLEALTGDVGAMEQTAETARDIALGTAGTIGGAKVGALLGAPLAPFTFGLSVPVGMGIGSIIGGATLPRAGEYFTDWITDREVPTVTQARNQVLEDVGTDLGLNVLTRGIGKAGKSALNVGADVAEVINKTTDSGADAVAARGLRRLGLDELALEKVQADEFGKSIAEQLQSEPLARLETALPKEYGESAGIEAAQRRGARADVRAAKLAESVKDPSMGRLEAGQTAYLDLAQGREALGKVVSELYEAIPGETRVNVSGVRKGIESVLDKRLTEGAIAVEKINPTVQQITLDLIDSADDISVQKLTNYRRILGEELSYDKPQSINKDLARSIRDVIDEELGKADVGLAEATAKRRTQGQLFDEGATGDILKKQGYGERKIPDSAVVKEILKTPESAAQYAKAASPEARRAVADSIVNDLEALRKTDKLAQAIKLYDDKLPQLGKILEPGEFERVTSVIDDFKSQLEMDRLAKAPSRGQSGTAQFEADQKGIKKLFQMDSGFADRHPWITRGGGALLGYVVGGTSVIPGARAFTTVIGQAIADKVVKTFQAAEDRVARVAYKALTDPAEASRVLRAATNADPFFLNVIKRIDSAFDSAAKTAGVEPSRLLSVTAPGTREIGERGIADYEREQRRQRVEEKAASLSELSDAQFLALARARGLYSEPGEPKKKVTTEPTGGKRDVNLPERVTDELLDALKFVESSGRRFAVSPKGAEGPYQLMPATGRRAHRILNLPGEYDPYNEEQARIIAKWHLEDGLKRFGRMDLALADYNLGHPGMMAAFEKAGREIKSFDDLQPALPRETAQYVPKVYERYKLLLDKA